MPFLQTEDLRVHHALDGPAAAPLLVFSNSLGTDLSVWDPQMPALAARFRVLRYDTRGHGRTSVTPGPCTIEQLARDVVRLLDALGLPRGHFCGLSVGGMIGMWLAVHAPQRVDKLVLSNTAPRIGTTEGWNARIDGIRAGGMKGIAAAVMERWLTPEFQARSPERFAAARAMLEQAPPEGYMACCAAIRDADLRGEAAAIRAPTLVIAGSRDVATPPADVRLLADLVPGARYVELEAAHLSNVEAPEAFTSELMGFLTA